MTSAKAILLYLLIAISSLEVPAQDKKWSIGVYTGFATHSLELVSLKSPAPFPDFASAVIRFHARGGIRLLYSPKGNFDIFASVDLIQTDVDVNEHPFALDTDTFLDLTSYSQDLLGCDAGLNYIFIRKPQISLYATALVGFYPLAFESEVSTYTDGSMANTHSFGKSDLKSTFALGLGMDTRLSKRISISHQFQVKHYSSLLFFTRFASDNVNNLSYQYLLGLKIGLK